MELTKRTVGDVTIFDLDGKPTIGFKLKTANAEAIIKDPRFLRAPYVGRYGGVSMDASAVQDWEEVRTLVLESYALIAPKRSLAKMAGKPATPRQSAPKAHRER